MDWKLGIGACAVLMIAPSMTKAEVSVEHLERICRGVTADNFSKNINHFACVNYIAGFWDGYNTVAWALPFQVICTPNGSNSTQFARVFLKWAENNPAKGHESAATGLTSALAETYPCPAS